MARLRTTDIDLGVQLGSDWSEFEDLKSALLDNRDRLMDEHADLLADDDFDYVRAGARLLGRDVGALVSPQTRQVLLEILEHETGERPHYRLAESMRRGSDQEAFEESLALLEAFKVGMEETESSPK